MEEARLQDVLKGNRFARFGAFELYLNTGELKKHGVRVRLQGKPFQILCALLQQPGHVVTREELRNKAWSSDTFVDFESGLNTAVNRLRMALGDSAENPIYIETLARLGYRFIAPVALAPGSQRCVALADLVSRDVTDGVLEIHRASANYSDWKRSWMLAGLLGVLALVVVGVLLWPLRSSRPELLFRQVTFRKGFVSNARFASGGVNVVYSAAWNGAPDRLFLAGAAAADSRDLGFDGAWLASLSATGEMAIFAPAKDHKTVLEAISLHGGAPRLLSDRAMCADWGPNGSLAVVTQKDSVFSVEYPLGRKLYNSNGWINNVRVSPRGDKVAFSEHPVFGDDAGQVVVVDSTGHSRVLSAGWGSLDGVAWHPSRQEVWFTAARSGVERALMAVDSNGSTRQVAQIPGGIQLRDISASGKVLIARARQRMIMLRGDLSDKAARTVRDISWLDWSHAIAMTADGQSVLFDESGAGGGKQYSVYLYRTAAPSPERIGDGRAIDLSSEGLWALTSPVTDPARLSLLSVASHKSVPISGLVLQYRWAKFFPGGKEILFEVHRAGKAAIYRQRVPDGNPILVKAGMELYSPVFEGTGQFVAGSEGESTIAILDLTTGAVRSIKTNKHLSPVVFSNKHQVLVSSFDGKTVVLDFLNLETARLTPYRRVELRESTGMEGLFPIIVAKDLKTYVYSRQQSLSDLFVVSGWN